jgi:CRISPR-associated protein Cas1
LSFVYDVADFYKTELTVPLAFRLAATEGPGLERAVRMACRQAFHDFRLMARILPGIAEVLDDLGEISGELEGRAVTLATPAAAGGVRGQPEQTSSGGAGDKGVQADQGGDGDTAVDGAQ